MSQKLVITIGSAEGNRLRVPFPQVDPFHARLTRLAGSTYLLEDLDSREGTEVNGVRIRRKVVSLTDKIKVSNVNVSPKLQELFPEAVPPSQDLKQAFQNLKEVYESYTEARKSVVKKTKWRNIAIRGSLQMIPFVGSTMALVVMEFISDTEKLEALDQEFRKHYVCPHKGCGVFFGDKTPWEQLAEAKGCRNCKKSWGV